jgi:phenylacetate-CoA ligase
VSLYGKAVERMLYPMWEGVLRGRPTLDIHDALLRSQWRSADELAAERLGALRRLLAHAATNVPFYRERFAPAGLAPEDIRSLDDLSRLPILTRDQAIDAGDTRAATAPPLADIRKSTGGTTGQPLKFGYDASSEYWRQAVKMRGWGWAGYTVGARVLYYWAVGATPPFSTRMKVGLDRLLKRERYVDCTQRSDADLDAAAAMIARLRPDVLVTFTQAGAELARHILARGLRRWDTIPVLSCAERLYPDDRIVLDAAFGPAVFETYGCREVMLIATECEAHAGLHVSAENLIVELVVREDGRERPARPGEAGEVVLTDLHNFGMPFIRYANGDLAVAAEDAPCPCGRSLPRIASVEGRVAETLRDSRGARVSGLAFNVLFTPLADRVRQFQAVQHRDGSVTLKIVPQGRPLERPELDDIQRRCAARLPGLVIKTEVVPEIPLTSGGKRRVVVVER